MQHLAECKLLNVGHITLIRPVVAVVVIVVGEVGGAGRMTQTHCGGAATKAARHRTRRASNTVSSGD